jgi:hypothetical protein
VTPWGWDRKGVIHVDDSKAMGADVAIENQGPPNTHLPFIRRRRGSGKGRRHGGGKGDRIGGIETKAGVCQ